MLYFTKFTYLQIAMLVLCTKKLQKYSRKERWWPSSYWDMRTQYKSNNSIPRMTVYVQKRRHKTVLYDRSTALMNGFVRYKLNNKYG